MSILILLCVVVSHTIKLAFVTFLAFVYSWAFQNSKNLRIVLFLICVLPRVTLNELLYSDAVHNVLKVHWVKFCHLVVRFFDCRHSMALSLPPQACQSATMTRYKNTLDWPHQVFLEIGLCKMVASYPYIYFFYYKWDYNTKLCFGNIHITVWQFQSIRLV